MQINRLAILGLATLGLAGAANAQLALSAGIYSANDSAVRDVFGSNAFAWGLGFGQADRAGRAGGGFDFVGLSLSAPGNRFSTIGATYGFEVQRGNDTNAMTYFRANAGVAYYDFSLGAPLVPSQDRYVRPITTLEAGVVLSKRFTLSAQYLLMPDAGNVNFSGFRIQALFSLTK
ncbi:MAG: hypothetical protein WCK51_04145 [Armatimonadota bacterium]